MTDVCTTALLSAKPSSVDDSGFSYGFGAEATLPLTQSTLAVTLDTTRLFFNYCHIHANAVRALPWIFFFFCIYSCLMDKV